MSREDAKRKTCKQKEMPKQTGIKGKMPRERDVQSKGFQEKEIKKERVGGRLYIYIYT
jgi:hypothetical protein